ncbi:MAG: hypothetical protein IKH06_01090, partial [Clostridiales bacterium]|nr:hypothetical protein [Clostridiales bacterium]
SKKGDTFIPYVTGFNFAKVEDPDSGKGTVFVYAHNAQNKSRDKAEIAKYIPDEWESAAYLGEDMDWSKVDIYSLGVFLCDMLMGHISDHVMKKSEMQGHLPDKMIDLIGLMTSEDIYERPDCKTVLMEIEQCQQN